MWKTLNNDNNNNNHRIKLKECEKKDKYLDLARELKKLWNMKLTIIQIGIGTFGTVTKGSINTKEKSKPGWEFRLETLIKKTYENNWKW